MSIKPEFANLIFAGKKRFEFRKKLFKHPSVRIIVVYASSPVQKVIGEFEIEEVLSSSPHKIWQETKKDAGISEGYFLDYFEEKETAYAIKIGKRKLYQKPLCLKKDFAMTPPQSFCYLYDAND